MTKTNSGNFFEDFAVGQTIRHATPRTVTRGDAALYQALYGNRFAVQSSTAFAEALGYPEAPLDDLLVFHVVFGKTVPDVSLNAIANLGYAGCRFLAPVYAGDTLSTVSEVIGVKENSNGKTGVVYVRSTGYRQDGAEVLDYARWVMVRKRDERSPAPDPVVPTLPEHLPADALGNSVPLLDVSEWDDALSGSPYRWGDYAVGERIDHVDGTTIEEAEHQMACRLFQNTAKVHFNQYTEGKGRFGRRLVYGGHVISTARALTFNGLGNAFAVAGINGGRHVNPSFAGDTIFAWSEILDKQPIHGRDDVGALRVRLVATKDRPCEEFPDRDAAGAPDPSVVLDLDWWLLMPR